MFQEDEPALLFPPKYIPPGSHGQQSSDISAGNITVPEVPISHGKPFSALCEFWVLTSAWTSVYYVSEESPMLDRVPVEFANRVFEKLLLWADGLHIMLARGDQSSHHSIILQLGHHSSRFSIPKASPSTPHLVGWR